MLSNETKSHRRTTSNLKSRVAVGSSEEGKHQWLKFASTATSTSSGFIEAYRDLSTPLEMVCSRKEKEEPTKHNWYMHDEKDQIYEIALALEDRDRHACTNA